jgi:alcohol dehydrogenase (cytochrome c)
MAPKLEKQDRNRGVALSTRDIELTAAPLALKDSIFIGGSGGDRYLHNWVAALDPRAGDIQ